MSDSPRRAVPKRVPPRRRRPRKTVFRNLVLPALKLTAVLVIIGLLGNVVACKVLRPFKLCSREDGETRRIASEFQTLKKENAELERRLNYLKTPDGIAKSSRRLGWVKPGEVTLVLPSDATEREPYRNTH